MYNERQKYRDLDTLVESLVDLADMFIGRQASDEQEVEDFYEYVREGFRELLVTTVEPRRCDCSRARP